MLPTLDLNHVAEGLAYLISQYQGKKNITAVLTACLNRIQDAENMLWDVIESQWLSTTAVPTGAPTQALLQLADLVKCPTSGLSGAQLAFLLPIWRAARRSEGLAEDLIQILATAFGKGNYAYAEYYPAAYEAVVPNVPDPTLVAPLVSALAIARDPGVYAVVAWGNWPAATFAFASRYASGQGTGFKDTYSGANAMGLLAAAVA